MRINKKMRKWMRKKEAMKVNRMNGISKAPMMMRKRNKTKKKPNNRSTNKNSKNSKMMAGSLSKRKSDQTHQIA